MSLDIRSYFAPTKVRPAKVEDEDVIPESPDVRIKTRKKESKKRQVLRDDSDEEIFTTKKKTDEKSKKADKSNKNKNTVKPILKEVKPVDLFGTGPIKRTEPIVKKKKNTEIGIHSDDEFEKSLLEIDNEVLEIQTNDLKVSDSDKNVPKKIESPKPSTEITTQKSPSKSENQTFSTNDISKEKHKHSNHSDSKRKKFNDEKVLKRDKKIDHSIANESISEKKNKMENGKRKFAEFIDSETSSDHVNGKKKKLNSICNEIINIDSVKDDDIHDVSIEDSMDEDNTKLKAKKTSNKSLHESVLTDEERQERRIASAALYKNYLNRSGPKNLGAKSIPEGTSDCLKDYAFVLTGVLDSFEKEEIAAAINKYGGCVKNSVTKKVTHLIAGEDAGPAKIAKAQDLGIKIINEDEFLKLITDSSEKKLKSETRKEIKKNQTPNKNSCKYKDELDIKEKNKRDKSETKTSKNKLGTEACKTRDKSKSPKKIKKENPIEPINISKPETNGSSSTKTTSQFKELPVNSKQGKTDETPTPASMWVEKYKPQNIKQIIGQQGDASNVKKLINWLTKWYVNRKGKLPKPNPWAKNDDGGYYKAVLLSGPPGVGKTTTVSLVCKELGFDMVEFNASDTRNKTLIKEQIGELLTTTSLSGYAKGEKGKQAITKKHVLIMDEVDGMAGNEDRGGLQELISLIKSASVPIICMCNDRNSQKMRSLVNYCYDLRFSKPRVEQIKSAMMSICFKEQIKIQPDVLAQLITSANQDIRQTINLLSMWAIDPALNDTEKLRKDAQISKKDIKLGPWEAIRKAFSAEDHKKMSINDKSDLFFYDYSIAPLFVQENYLQVAPHCPKHEVLNKISGAADSISMGDLVDARIRGSQAWSLLPFQAMYASVIPGHEMSGHMTGQIQFPGWLGKNSRTTKMRRLCQEIHGHTRLSTSGSKSSIYLDYASHLRDAIVNPLIKDKADGITQSLEVLQSYNLLREDMDSLVELSVWPGQRNPTILIDPKVKAAMTRTYNKKAAALPYAPGTVRKGRGGDYEDTEDEDWKEEEPVDSDPENDILIKKKKTKDTDKSVPSKEKNSKSSSSKKKKEK